MSGPLAAEDVPQVVEEARATRRGIELTDSRLAKVGTLPVRRALPRRERRTVGAWCFADHSGPVAATGDGFGVGPHPHMGLQTVTWLLDGELLHRDSLGSEQPIRPGQLNLMTAGRGIAHAEEQVASYTGELHGIQLWVAQPQATRNGDAAFEHHAELPCLELAGGIATVLVGELGGAASTARRDTDHVGVDLDLRAGASTVPLRPDHEFAVIVLSGAIEIEGVRIQPGHLAYLGADRDECTFSVDAPARAMLLGGEPFAEPILMWWNFVARDRDEMVEAYRHWATDDGWFGTVDSILERIPVTPPPWLAAR